MVKDLKSYATKDQKKITWMDSSALNEIVNSGTMEPNVLEHQLECFALTTSSPRGRDQI